MYLVVCVCVCACTLSWLTLWEFLRTMTGFIQDALAQQGSWHCVWHYTPVAVFDVFNPLLRKRGPSPQMQIQGMRKRTGKVCKREEVLEKYDWCSLSGLRLTLPCSQVSAQKVCATFHTLCGCVCVCVATFAIWTSIKGDEREMRQKKGGSGWAVGRRDGGERGHTKRKGSEWVKERVTISL